MKTSVQSMKMNIQNKEQWHDAFMQACDKGILEDLHHLCQKQYLDCGWADIHIGDEKGFHLACNNGHLEVVKYLLTTSAIVQMKNPMDGLQKKQKNCKMKIKTINQ